jgi:hypothetical protein
LNPFSKTTGQEEPAKGPQGMNGEQPGLLEGAIPPERNTVLFGHDSAQDFLPTAYRSGGCITLS